MPTQRSFLDLSQINERVQVLDTLGWQLGRIRSAWIMVIGAGALGNEVLKNLALIGVGNIFLVDFDVVEPTNLARSVLFRESDCTGDRPKVEVAAQRVRELNPEQNIIPVNGDISAEIGWGVFRRMDAIIGCVDNRLARLHINRIAHRLGKSWIDGGILDLGGQLNVFQPGVSCYECQLGEQAWKNIKWRMGCTNRAMRYASSGQANTIPITSSIIGAVQVQEALRLIASEGSDSHMADKQLFYEGQSSTFELLPVSKLKPRCESHQRIEEILSVDELSHRVSVGEALAWLKDHFQDPDLTISLDHTLIMEVASEQSGARKSILRLRPLLSESDYQDILVSDEDSMMITQKVAELDDSFPFPEKSLSELGIPPLHILSVYTQGSKQYVELTGDESVYFS